MNPELVSITRKPLHGQGVAPGDHVTGYLACWVPRIGPTATLAFQHLHREAPDNLELVIDLPDLAARIGVGHKGGKNSPLQNAITRLYRFRFVGIEIPTEAQDHITIVVAEQIPLLTSRHCSELPPDLQRLEKKLAQQAFLPR